MLTWTPDLVNGPKGPNLDIFHKSDRIEGTEK
jgi:hypothetical protein